MRDFKLCVRSLLIGIPTFANACGGPAGIRTPDLQLNSLKA